LTQHVGNFFIINKNHDILHFNFTGNLNQGFASLAEFYGSSGGRAFFGLLHQKQKDSFSGADGDNASFGLEAGILPVADSGERVRVVRGCCIAWRFD